MATPIRFGTEFLVNTTVVSGQSFSTSTALADGRFVVSWTDVSSSGGNPTGFAVWAQVYNADGTKSGTEFLVNSTTAGHQHESAIAGLNDGRFVVTWNDGSASGADATGSSIKAQIFNVNGTPSGAELLINTITTGDQSQPAFAVLSDGRFVVTWTDISLLGGDNSNHGIRAQMFNADDSQLGAEFLVNSVIASSQDQPAITALENGRFVVTWRIANPTGGDGSFTAIKAQVFNAIGTPSGLSSWSTPRRPTVSSSRRSPDWPMAALSSSGAMTARPRATRRVMRSGRKSTTSMAVLPGLSSWSTPRPRPTRFIPPSPHWPMAASSWSGKMPTRQVATPRCLQFGARCSTPMAARPGRSSWSTR